MNTNELKDTSKTVLNQYGVDPKKGLKPNANQALLIAESDKGNLDNEDLSKSISQYEDEIKNESDPKTVKEMTKKLENMKQVANRPTKSLDMDLENEWKPQFDKVDELINELPDSAKVQLVRNVFINENPKWHPERNSLVHIKIVTSRGITTGDRDLIDAALFHDIAKFDTVSLNATGWPTSLGHDKAGAESAKNAGKNPTVVYVCANHMKIKGWQGDSEGGTLNPSTKFEIFAQAPGENNNEKAKAFYKLCVFSKMDNMAYKFDASKLKWDNPSYDNWDKECPLREEFKKSELAKIEPTAEEKAKSAVPFTSQEIMKFGAKGPQIGQINGAIKGKSKEEAFDIIKQILGNPNLTMESRKWIKTFESFRRSK